MLIALVDDTANDRRCLEQILREYDAIHRIGMSFCHYDSGEAFLRDFQPFRFAVVFMDVYMSGMSGVETSEKLREKDADTILVFLTTSDEHRADAFSVFASAYLSKPCASDQVYRVLDHIFRLNTESEGRFSFSFDRKDYSLRFSEIVSLETSGNYLAVTDTSGNVFRTRMTFSAAESRLDSRFLTLMKGIIVNMDHISNMSEMLCLMKSGASFPLHVKNQKDLRQKWLNYKFAKIREETASEDSHVH